MNKILLVIGVGCFRRKAVVLLLTGLTLTALFLVFSRLDVSPADAETLNPATASPYTTYDLSKLTQNLSQFNGANITTSGIARFLGSIYMFEDFWLQAQNNQSVRIPVAIRFAGIPKPSEGDLIEVNGTITFNSLEGGFLYLNASGVENLKNVLLIGWDGAQRNHLFELLNRGLLPNLQSLINEGVMKNVTVSDHRTDTRPGWTQTLTGYWWWRPRVYSNVFWFNAIPAGYTIPERVESEFGKNNVKTGFITGKEENMEDEDGTGSAVNGTYTHEALYRNVAQTVDFCNVGDRQAGGVGPLALQFIENSSNSHFFAFFHFGDPDEAGHNRISGGENSILYENAIIKCDYWLGQIVNTLKAQNLTRNTLIYVTADHGFDEGAYTHHWSPDSFLATNDKRVSRTGDQVDVAPTVYYGLGMWGNNFSPALDGYPMQLDLPEGVEQHRQNVMDNYASMIKPTFVSPMNGANVSGIVKINFNVSDIYLNAVILIINDTLVADGPWGWSRSRLIEANCSYNWDTTTIPAGTYEIRVFLFDEHGSTNGPEQGAVTVNVVAPPPVTIPEFTPGLAILLIAFFVTLTIFAAFKKELGKPRANISTSSSLAKSARR